MGLTAIFGGTFNPFHIGHYEMLEAINQLDFIDEILLMPDRIPPHKECDFLAGDEHRIEMCRIISEDFKKVKLCLIEFEREGKSYTYDTVLELKTKFPDKNFTFVCGGDMITTLDKWYKFEELIKEISFISFGRFEILQEQFYKKVKSLKDIGADITVIDKKITAVSSTQIRRDIEGNKRLLPERIYNYIKDKRIYIENQI